MDWTLDSIHRPWTVRRVMLVTLTIVAVVLVFWLLIRFKLVVFSLFEAMVFGTAIHPWVNGLQKHHIPRPVGTAVIFVALMVLLIGFGTLTLPLIYEQGATLSAVVVSYYQAFHNALSASPSFLIQRLATRLPQNLLIGPTAPTDGNTLGIINKAWAYLGLAGSSLFAVTAVLLLTFYWVLERERSIRILLLMAPSDRRENISQVISSTEERVGAYMRGLAILSVVVGSLALAAYLLIGLPHALLLGIIAGVFEVVPLVGPILGALPAVLVALSSDPTKILWVLLAIGVIQFSENHLLVPRVMNKTVGINPVVSLLAFAAFSSLFGLAGALLAIPLAVLIQILFDRLVLSPESMAPASPLGRDRLAVLRYEAMELVQDVRKQVRVKEGDIREESDEVEDTIEAIVSDLDSILAGEETEQVKP